MAKYEQRPLSQNSIRQALKKAQDRSRSSKPELSRVHSDMAPIGVSPGTTLDDEGTSSLFYYLFEDYTAAGPLKAAGQILEDLVRHEKTLGYAVFSILLTTHRLLRFCIVRYV